MKSNFNSETLLCNLPITLIDKRGGTYILILPTLRDKLENLDYDTFVSFCTIDLREINGKLGTNFKDRFALFKAYKNNKADIMPILDKFFKKYMMGFKYVDDSLYWGERLVGKEIFEAFCNYIAIASGVKSLKSLELIITDDMDEVEKRRIMLERKIQETKRKGESSRKQKEFDVILSAVVKEFGYQYKDLLDMTLYSIYFMYSLLGLIMNYEVGNIAAGNGLLKNTTKHNHWGH